MQSNLCVVVLYKSQHLRFICTMKRVYGEQKLYKRRQKKAYILNASSFLIISCSGLKVCMMDLLPKFNIVVNGWSGGAMVLGELPGPGRPPNLD